MGKAPVPHARRLGQIARAASIWMGGAPVPPAVGLPGRARHPSRRRWARYRAGSLRCQCWVWSPSREVAVSALDLAVGPGAESGAVSDVVPGVGPRTVPDTGAACRARCQAACRSGCRSGCQIGRRVGSHVGCRSARRHRWGRCSIGAPGRRAAVLAPRLAVESEGCDISVGSGCRAGRAGTAAYFGFVFHPSVDLGFVFGPSGAVLPPSDGWTTNPSFSGFGFRPFGKLRFGFCPSGKPGFVSCPFKAVFRLWMDEHRTQDSSMDKTRTPSASMEELRTLDARDGRKTNPGFADGRTSNHGCANG